MLKRVRRPARIGRGSVVLPHFCHTAAQPSAAESFGEPAAPA
jgi:hypothetical protein